MAAKSSSKLAGLRFDNRFTRILPVDADTSQSIRDPVRDSCYARVKPLALKNPRIVAVSESALGLLGVEAGATLKDEDAAELLAGNRAFEGADPVAHCYCGYQFGYFSGQLGDGAAMSLGEVVGADDSRWEFQFKGSGQTPFSRHADGRKVLRSSLREFLCSEAIASLGIPTTRAGSVVTSDSTIVRDVFYTNDPAEEQCSVITRIAPTFLRFGSFEIFKAEDEMTGRSGPSPGNEELRCLMVDYVCNAFFADVVKMHAPPGLSSMGQEGNGLEGVKIAGTDAGAPVVFEVFKEILRRTARTVAQWQLVGWCHGVLNTDNMSILGLTLDYGPFAFMDRFDWDYVCNTSDDRARYTYRNQPAMCRWNCERLAVAWSSAMPGMNCHEALKTEYDTEFKRAHLEGARRKLGLAESAGAGDSEDEALFKSLLDCMHATGADFTNTFRALMTAIPVSSDVEERSAATVEALLPAVLSNLATADDVRVATTPRIDEERVKMLLMMAPSQPQLRPHIPMLEKELGAWSEHKKYLGLTEEAKTAADAEKWTPWLESYASRLELDRVTARDCAAAETARVQRMANANPAYVLRNFLCQIAIRAAEDGDFEEARMLLRRMQDPFGKDSSVPTALSATAVEYQRAGKVRGGNVVELGDAPPAPAAAASAASASASASTCAVGGAVSEAVRSPAFAERFDSLPPKWACKLRVSCSS